MIHKLQQRKLMKLFIYSVLLFLFTIETTAQNKYACFQNDVNPNLKISVLFDSKEKVHSVQYYSKKDKTILYYSKTTKTKNTGGHPPVYIAVYYIERYKGKVTGTYIFTNAGTHGSDVTFIRKSDGKEFYFSIIEGSQSNGESTFRNTSCF